MNPQTMFFLMMTAAAAATLLGALALIGALKSRAEARRTLAVMLQMENELNDLSRDLDAASRRSNEYARRIAWLESRFGLGTLQEVEPAPAAAEQPAPAKPSMTERRHRVLSLARRGLDARAIASTLGVPHGEVDLIIGLSNVA